jgi:O-acetyl-ADP-ribose deacetylase
MTINHVCSSYFNGVDQISHCRQNSAQTNLVALLKIASYFTIIIPASFGLAYGIVRLTGRLGRQAKQKEPTNKVASELLTSQKEPSLIGAQSQESRKTRAFDNSIHTPMQIKKSMDGKTLEITLPTPGFTCIIEDSQILTSGAQVIVNAANSSLSGGGGVDGAIHKAGGQAYASEHRAILRSHYPGKLSYPLGDATMISSGNMKETYNIDSVIVVAGPRGASTPQKDNQLYACYYNSLVLAHEQNKTRIAFPSISTGIFGFPKDRAAAIFIQAVDNFSKQYLETELKHISLHVLGHREDLKFFEEAAQPST